MVISMETIRQSAARHGSHWFEPSTMRFFRSRVGWYGYQSDVDPDTVYFVSSEKGPNGVRAYTVRQWRMADGRMETVGDFQQYASLDGATAAARRMAGGAS